MDWQRGDAFHPQTFAHLFPKVDGVVHTLGTLIEDTSYKGAVQNGNAVALLSSVFKRFVDGGNPLKKKPTTNSADGNPQGYEAMNRDSGAY